jgi:hypothetical protein
VVSCVYVDENYKVTTVTEKIGFVKRKELQDESEEIQVVATKQMTEKFHLYVSLHMSQVVALDLRGYNLSDKPIGGEHYSMHHLVGDVRAVIRHTGRDKAIISCNIE